PNGLRTKMASMASWMDVDGDLIPDGVAPIVFRLQCMDAAARNIIDSPIVGIGAGNFKVTHPLFESQLERKVLGEETLARKVHNDHLYHAVEFGIFGLLGWYWLITATFFAIIHSLRFLEYQTIAANSKDKKTSFYEGIVFPTHVREFYFYLQWGILTGLIVAVVSCAFGHTFVISSSAVIYWFLSGVSVAIYQKLHLANHGLRTHYLGVTQEPLPPVQQKTRRLPGFVWLSASFLFILPFGVLNTYQLIGETWLRHGMTGKEEGNYAEMFTYFQKAMDYYPYQMEIYYILGRYYIDAVVAVETAAMSPNGDSLPELPYGLNYQDRRRYNEEGIVTLQTDIFLNPNYKWAHNNLGVLYDRYYDLIKAETKENVGTLFNITPDPEQAAAVMEASKITYERVLEVDKEQIYAHFNLGLGAIKMQQYDKAIEPLNRALITDPSRYDIYKYLSNCYLYSKDYKRAMRSAEKYMEKVILLKSRSLLRSDQELNKYQQITQAIRNNDHEKALTLARLLINFNDMDCYNLFIGIASEMSELKEIPDRNIILKALDLAEKVNANPTLQHYLWHAKIYERIGEFQKAVGQVEEYLRVKPDDDKMRHSLMMLYVQMDDLQGATKVMGDLVARQPDNWEYLITYARLLAGVNKPWAQIFPFVQRAIQIGEDDARRVVVEEQEGNLLLPMVKKDPRMYDLLGPSFLPVSSTPSISNQEE
ncbi:MAG: hypothetical protein ACP5I1_03925, partial [Candidatus Hinthialibacter sp.]